ncbi:MAG: TylF/MycF/NovP-related O-methyltransferase [Patescibacteria group bacterium]
MHQEEQFAVPILIMAFNRANITQRVFDEIKKVKPKQLFFAVDGPRNDRPGEDALCQATRDIVKQVDWDCEVKTLFPEKNAGIQGIRSGPTVALQWFFEQVEEGIIFEDDCLPHPSFFQFCSEMLEYYKDDERVMHISGNNFQFGRKRGDASYYFSIYPSTWGWATWRRAWNHFDASLASFPTFRDGHTIAKITAEKDAQNVWLDTFRKEYYGEWKTWDYEWVYAIWSRGGLAVIPNVNLVSNIGFGTQATHNFSPDNIFANIPTEEMKFPLTHPKEIMPDTEADQLIFATTFASKKPFLRKIKDHVLNKMSRKTKNVLKAILRYPATMRESVFFKKLSAKYRDYSMIPQDTFVENLRLAHSFSHIKGSVVECGVWRGGMIAAMAEMLGGNRAYYLFDSFEGLPPAQNIDGYRARAWQNDTTSKIYFDNCKAEAAFAQKAMAMSGTKNSHIVPGWFANTLKGFKPDGHIAILRLDGDWYESTMQCLEGLYRYVAPGGVIIIDDYYMWAGCAKAVHDFLSRSQSSDTIHTSRGGVCYIVKQPS